MTSTPEAHDPASDAPEGVRESPRADLPRPDARPDLEYTEVVPLDAASPASDPYMTDVLSADEARIIAEIELENLSAGMAGVPAADAPSTRRAGRAAPRPVGVDNPALVTTESPIDTHTAVLVPPSSAPLGEAVASVRPAPIDPPVSPLSELDARSISAWFGDHQVLLDVSLTMPAGQVTALIGPSGCGKSTFLRILNRMHELVPSAALAGEVLLDGDDIYDAGHRLIDARKNIGMVFQKPNPFPAMSIYDNVIAGLKLTGKRAARDEKDHLVETSLQSAGLWKEVKDRLRAPGGGLSGGQQQRLCIARSLAIKPKVLLMDEPCSALDPTSTRVIEETMGELQKELTIVIVTHNMQQAQRVSQQCAFFLASQGQPGHIVEHGDTDAMFDSPIDPRTYDYVNGRFG
jgi:phosphate ABC transporter ATP-binding protein